MAAITQPFMPLWGDPLCSQRTEEEGVGGLYISQTERSLSEPRIGGQGCHMTVHNDVRGLLIVRPDEPLLPPVHAGFDGETLIMFTSF